MIAESTRSIADNRWTVPSRVDIFLSVLDCGSRLLATTRARCYDKIRRSLNTTPQRIRGHFSELDLAVPEVHLRIQGLDSILAGYSASETMAVCETVERAALDAGLDRIRLLEIDVSGGSHRADDITMIPDLLHSCPSSELVLQIGSSANGANARDLYATSLILLLNEVKPDVGARLILACNTFSQHDTVVHAENEIDIGATFSVWPLMDGIRGELPIDACYSDRASALGFVGQKVVGIGNSHLGILARMLSDSDVQVGDTRVNLTINAPGQGPAPAAIWAGFPFSSNADAASNRAAAAFLRQGLTGNIGLHQSAMVETDFLPLTSSTRNIHAVSTQMTPANLAGYLVRLFSDAIENKTCRYIRLISSPDGAPQHGAALENIAGTIPFAEEAGWMPSHFVDGGLLIGPSSATP